MSLALGSGLAPTARAAPLPLLGWRIAVARDGTVQVTRVASLLSGASQVLESLRVKVSPADLDHVARSPRGDDCRVTVRSKQAPQRRNSDLRLGTGRRRQVFTVNRFQQPVHGDNPVGVEQKHRQDDLLTHAAQLEPLGARRDLKRSEDPEFHPITAPHVEPIQPLSMPQR